MSKCWYLLRLGMPSVPKRLFPRSLECLLRFANHLSSTLFLFVFAQNRTCCNQRREFQFIWNDFTLLYFTTWWKVNSDEKFHHLVKSRHLEAMQTKYLQSRREWQISCMIIFIQFLVFPSVSKCEIFKICTKKYQHGHQSSAAILAALTSV